MGKYRNNIFITVIVIVVMLAQSCVTAFAGGSSVASTEGVLSAVGSATETSEAGGSSAVVSAVSLNLESVPEEWEGEYDGKHESALVRRNLQLSIQSIDSDGKIRGTAVVSPSGKSNEKYGVNGSYFFTGNIDAATGSITVTGSEWIEKPDNGLYSDWSFETLTGRIEISESGAYIHGTSQKGIWEMEAAGSGVVSNLSGFSLGENNNSFSHSNTKTWTGSGFYGITDYSIDDEYFEKLTKNSGFGEKNRVKKAMREEWSGSCYGIAMSMGLLYEGYIDISDLTNDKSATNYYSLKRPCEDKKLLNMINYYQLSQKLKSGGRKSSVSSVTYSSNFIKGLVNKIKGYDSLSEFLKKLVSNCNGDHVWLLCYSAGQSGHAVLATGCEYDKSKGQYKIQIYDENSVSVPPSKGGFRYMTIDDDFTSFLYTDIKGTRYTEENFNSMRFMEWDSLGGIIAGTSSEYKDAMTVSFSSDTDFRMVGENGKYLEYNGSSLSGDAAVYDIYEEAYGDDSRITVKTDEAENFRIENIDGQADIEFESEDEYISIESDSAESAEINMGKSLKLDGDDYDFRVYVTAGEVSYDEAGLVSIEGEATGGTDIEISGGNVSVESEEQLCGVTATSYEGAETETELYSGSQPSFNVSVESAPDGEDDASGEAASDGENNETGSVLAGKGLFADVKSGQYYYDAVSWAVQNNVTEGAGNGLFLPDEACTRAQAITFIWRAQGRPAASGPAETGETLSAEASVTTEISTARITSSAEVLSAADASRSSPFSDVAENKYYDAIMWAAGENIAKGTSADLFSPDRQCTRAQIVTFMWRAAGCPETSGVSFDDVSDTSCYAKAISWASSCGITTGTGNNSFSPNAVCTRAQIVTFLFRANSE